jgi:enamine deaminase RidA (YjgF/YER057c/UK114 family)
MTDANQGTPAGATARLRVVQPAGWAPPRGYANGVAGRGRETLFVAGQIGWDAACRLVGPAFLAQFDQALANVVAVVEAAGGRPADVARMTVYVVDLDEYRAAGRELGRVWRARFGSHYPAMALVKVAGLLEPGARVEIEATALIGEP